MRGEDLLEKLPSIEIARTLILSSLYAVLTISLGDLGYSVVQIRVSECLTPTPFIWGLPAVIGITFGVLLANLFSPIGIMDLIFGPIITFIAALLSWKVSFGRRFLACFYPIAVNSLGVSLYVSHFYGVSYFLTVVSIATGESIACLLIGYPLLLALERTHTLNLFHR